MPFGLEFLERSLQETTGACADRSLVFRIQEADKEEGDLVFPWNPAKALKVRYRNDISVPVLFVADLQFPEVRLVVHVPSKYDRTEAKAISSNG